MSHMYVTLGTFTCESAPLGRRSIGCLKAAPRRIAMSQKAIWGVALLLASTGVTRAAQGSDRKIPLPTVKNAPASPTDAKAVSAAKGLAYVIGPEDVLDVTVWKEPDMSRVVPVRPDGQISLPLINDVQAAGLSPEQLAATVAEKL